MLFSTFVNIAIPGKPPRRRRCATFSSNAAWTFRPRCATLRPGLCGPEFLYDDRNKEDTALREIGLNEITDAVARMCTAACCRLPQDVLDALARAQSEETGRAAWMLSLLRENARLAADAGRPCCQDTGMAVVLADLGRDVHLTCDLYEAVNEGVRRGYGEGWLRKSVLTPLTRENTKDNTPAVVHLRLTEGDRLRLTLMPKGFGSENRSRLAMLNPSDGQAGVEAFILETARLGAASACPPVVLGVGVGGTFESCALLAKRQLARPLGQPSDEPLLADMERRLLAEINALGIGPGGLGGKTTALAVHIAQTPTHIAGLPVAVNVQCHAMRHQEVVL